MNRNRLGSVLLIITLMALAAVGGWWLSTLSSGSGSTAQRDATIKAPVNAKSLPAVTPSSGNGMAQSASADQLPSAHIPKGPHVPAPLGLFESTDKRRAVKENVINKHDKLFGQFYTKLPIDKALALKDLQASQLLWLADNADANAQPPPVDQFTKAQAEYDQQIKELLGNEAYGDFLNYRKTVPDRMLVESFAARAMQAGITIPAEKVEALNNLVIENRKNIFSNVTGENQALPTPSEAEAASMQLPQPSEAQKTEILKTHAEFSEKVAATNQSILQQAGQILDPASATLFTDVMSSTPGYEPYVKVTSGVAPVQVQGVGTTTTTNK